MDQISRSFSGLQTLAARWRIWGKVLVVLARQVSLANKMGAHCGLRQAEMLEASVYVALVQISADIAAVTAEGAPENKADEDALKHLHSIHVALAVLALLVSQLRRDLEAFAGRLAARAEPAFIRFHRLPCAPVQTAHSLDSS